jgi:pyruvate kinase
VATWAVECGYQKLAEVQEEILSDLRGSPRSRGLGDAGAGIACEEGDSLGFRDHRAAMGERAERVILNKGPYIVTAVRILDASRSESRNCIGASRAKA